MPLVPSRPVSARRAEANRRNAIKSTGPRTWPGKRRVSRNALRHGWYASPDTLSRELLARRGDDPAECDRLRQTLMEAWRPADAMQAMLVDDLAALYWQKVRAERAQAATQLRELRKAELEREQRQLDERRNEKRVRPGDVEVFGYRRAENCEEKFDKLAKLLERLASYAEHPEWSKEVEETLICLYGQLPTQQGGRIIALFQAVGSGGQAATPGRTGDPEGPEELKKLVQEERLNVEREQELYRRKRAAASDAPVELSWMPLSSQWSWVLKQQAALDREIERKVKLLVQLKRVSSVAPARL